MLGLDATEQGRFHGRWELVISLNLLVPGVAHLGACYRIELLGLDPRGEIR